MAPQQGRFPEDAVHERRGRRAARRGDDDGRSLGYRSQPAPHAAFVGDDHADGSRHRAPHRRVLGERGIDERTLVMFISDNGPHQEGGADPVFFKSSGGLRGIKRDLYEGGIRVPMIARWRGTIPAGRVSDHVWAHWDMLPTLAELAGAKTPPALDGLSMARALTGQPQPTHDFLYWEFHERGFQQAVRDGTLEGRAAGQGRAARALRPGERPARRARRRRRPTATWWRASSSTCRRRGPSRPGGR